MDKSPELSIILPAYNEGLYIEDSLKKIQDVVDKLNVTYELIVVDDGSTDNTLLKVKRCESSQVKVVTYFQNRGKGYAVKEGMLYAQGKYRLLMDVDLSTSLSAIERFLNLMRTNDYDVVIGNRKTHPHLQKIRQPWYHRFFGKGFTWLSCLMIGCFLNDFTCGFKMYRKEAADIIFKRQRIFNWAFDAELIYIAMQHHLKIHQEPVEWSHHPDSKVRLFNNIVTSLAGLMQMRINGLKGYYR